MESFFIGEEWYEKTSKSSLFIRSNNQSPNWNTMNIDIRIKTYNVRRGLSILKIGQ